MSILSPEEPSLPLAPSHASRRLLNYMPTVKMTWPESVVIEMVEASALTGYEFWSLMTSVLFTSTVAFAVASLQAQINKHWWWAVTVVLAVLFAVFLWRTLWLRHSLRKKSKTVDLVFANAAQKSKGPTLTEGVGSKAEKQ